MRLTREVRELKKEDPDRFMGWDSHVLNRLNKGIERGLTFKEMKKLIRVSFKRFRNAALDDSNTLLSIHDLIYLLWYLGTCKEVHYDL